LTVEKKPIRSYAPLVKKVAPAVVNISGIIPRKGPKATSIGSGFIVGKEGYVVTADHIISNATEITVTLIDNRRFDAKTIGRDSAAADVALLRTKADGSLPVALLGDSQKLNVGDFVVSIGNPFGSWPTASAGIVGAIGGAGVLSSMGAGFIQTDASINPGNAGGPMFNLTGEVVGVNTALIDEGQHVGFATPINVVKSVLKTFVSQY